MKVPGYCSCSVPARGVHEGVLTCDTCGQPIPDPLLVRLLAELIAQRRRLEELERTVGAPKKSGPEWLAAKELAPLLGRSLDFVYRHADELGAMRVGEGPRPRLLFPVSSDAFRRDSDETTLSAAEHGQPPS